VAAAGACFAVLWKEYGRKFRGDGDRQVSVVAAVEEVLDEQHGALLKAASGRTAATPI
jgi:hypothetical protein